MKINAFNLNELKTEMADNNIDHLFKVDNGGHLTLTNHGGISVLINTTGEVIFVQYYNDNILEIPIEYEDDAFFWFRETKYYLSEFMRNNYGKLGDYYE